MNGCDDSEAGDLDRALPHYRKSIRYCEIQGDRYGLGQTRFNVALALANAGRLDDSREYALAALRDFETSGPAAAADVEKAKRLIQIIENAAAQQKDS